ncbi:MAG: protein phosphatase CheZ [Alphaproteobacteria bacterium]|nr:protein phosphatase CheZ [Alphaproteobacteria bacterium]MBO6627835.1 protein phosphatase CheZ [Alphaproteobacteria bacterium]MDF1625404.1 protein phosphatase CheZ [Parvibaculaceae bacterium]
MAIARRKFRIESVNSNAANSVDGMAASLVTPADGRVAGYVPDEVAADRHQAVMDAIAMLSRSMGSNSTSYQPDEPDDAPSEALLQKYKEEIKEAAKLKNELDLMQAAITQTKREIMALRYDGASSDRIRSVTDELDEVVAGTEAATETILGAVETIDSNASSLSLTLSGADAGQALEIQEQVINIFEACNFQDITGQRITKVVNALRYIEERIEKMLTIWGESAFAELEPLEAEHNPDEPLGRSLANGPSMPEAEDRASQADIDALFD